MGAYVTYVMGFNAQNPDRSTDIWKLLNGLSQTSQPLDPSTLIVATQQAKDTLFSNNNEGLILTIIGIIGVIATSIVAFKLFLTAIDERDGLAQPSNLSIPIIVEAAVCACLVISAIQAMTVLLIPAALTVFAISTIESTTAN